jgi:hypothetical protein
MFSAALFCAGFILGSAMALLIVAVMVSASDPVAERARPRPAGNVVPFRRRA